MNPEALAHPVLVLVAAGILIAVFLRGAVHKALDFNWFAHTLGEFRMLPAYLAVPVAGLLAACEFGVVFGLVFPATRPYAAIGAALLLAIYGIAVAVNLLRGRSRIDCGCGGSGTGLSWFHVARNAILAGLALIAAQSPAPAALTPLDWITALAAVGSFWLLLIGGEKLAENWSYLAAADDSVRQREIETEAH